jgi:hypothetical protein
VFGVDAVLSTAMLNHLNRIPGIEVNSVCAGHGLDGGGYFAHPQAHLFLRTNRTLGLKLVTEFGKLLSPRFTGFGQMIDFRWQGLWQMPGLFYNGNRWHVQFQCIAKEKRFNHRDGWEMIVPWLEQMMVVKKSAQRRTA